jgi:hypothetical protein
MRPRIEQFTASRADRDAVQIETTAARSGGRRKKDAHRNSEKANECRPHSSRGGQFALECALHIHSLDVGEWPPVGYGVVMPEN